VKAKRGKLKGERKKLKAESLKLKGKRGKGERGNPIAIGLKVNILQN